MPVSTFESDPTTSWTQKLLLISFSFVLVGSLELGLRFIGLGGRPPLLLPLTESTEPSAASGFFQINPSLADPFFGRASTNGRDLLGGHRSQLVQVPKPPNTIRVLFVGGSTVEGFPLPRNLTAATFLKFYLQSALPDHHVEVVNLGVTAVASFAVREIAIEALDRLDPDLLLVYTGHNEFFGAAGLESRQKMGSSIAAMRAIYWLRASALYQSASALFPSKKTAGTAPTQLIDVMAGVDEIEPAGNLHKKAAHILEANVSAIIRSANESGVPVVVSTLVSNERHLAPLASWEGDQTKHQSTPLQPRIEKLRLRLPQEASIVITELEALVQSAPLHAGAAFAYAQALDSLERSDQAIQFYQIARDLDAMPWRAASDKNEVLRQVAWREGATLADSATAFAEAAGGSPGWDLFFDHLHPNLRGQALLAQTLFDSVREHSLLPFVPAPAASRPDWRRVAQKLGANQLEHFLLSGKMAKFFRDSPIGANNPGAIKRFKGAARLVERNLDSVGRVAVVLWRNASEGVGRYLPISWFGGISARANGDLPRALVFLETARASGLFQ